MVTKEDAPPSTLAAIVALANPVFIYLAVGIPVISLIVALNIGSLVALNFVHIFFGGLWTGIDLFMGFVLGPVLGAMAPGERVAIFRRLIPRMTFLMPVLAAVTVTAGIQLAQQLGYFSLSNIRVDVALGFAALLTIQGFGLLLPNEVRIFRQLLSPKPDVALVSRLGMQNARLGGLQGVFQVGMILTMAFLRF